MNDSFEETAAEMVETWDTGELVWSISMGGLGPGYEQAIQVLAIELMRDLVADPGRRRQGPAIGLPQGAAGRRLRREVQRAGLQRGPGRRSD